MTTTSPFRRAPIAFIAYWVVVAVRLWLIRPIRIAVGRPVD